MVQVNRKHLKCEVNGGSRVGLTTSTNCVQQQCTIQFQGSRAFYFFCISSVYGLPELNDASTINYLRVLVYFCLLPACFFLSWFCFLLHFSINDSSFYYVFIYCFFKYTKRFHNLFGRFDVRIQTRKVTYCTHSDAVFFNHLTVVIVN